MEYWYKNVISPVGRLKLVAGEAGLTAILWENDPLGRVRIETDTEDQVHPILVKTEKQLNEYFAGTRKRFSLTLNFVGTHFQRSVWLELLKIPFGETTTYGELAQKLGKPGAARAVGAANGKNPISIIAPCHRVIASSGSLAGFAGGLACKEYLLQLEQRDYPLKTRKL